MIKMSVTIDDVNDALNEMINDATVPKNVKIKLNLTLKALSDNNEDISLRINKALNELDELTDDINIESFTRTQLWNIVSMLEMI
ncbi:MAG: UPF0147 family protein [Candidatus Woesearchaeota archaeon]